MSLMVKDILNIGKNRLAEAGCLDPKIDAEALFCHMMQIDQSRLFMSWAATLPDELCETYFTLLDVRGNGIPLQHITGWQAFMGLRFSVNDKVLIPRQDTETLVETALELIKQHKTKKVLDLCTGSGAIAISIYKCSEKKTRPDVLASDLSEEALEVARRNAKELNAKSIKFVKGDLFAPFRKKTGRQGFDLIVTNPPYIKSGVIAELQVEVREHEPRMALDGGDDGLLFYRRIIEEAPQYLKKEGILLMEIGHDQAESIRELAADCGNYEAAEIRRDLAGHNRIAILRKGR